MEMNFESEVINTDNSWSNIGGCDIKHPFKKEKKAECEANYFAKKEGSAKNITAQAELELAKAAAAKASQADSSWTAGQTAMVIGASLLGLTIMIVVIKKMSNRNKAKA